MSTEGLIMADETTSCGSAPGSTPCSPRYRNRVKFLCSHGGKILPRPADGHLKYVGGETRVISVPRDIKFSEIMKKLMYQIEEEMVLKYQLVPEDLDTLVSVKNDEDLRHMFSEHDLYESTGTPRLRAFLFPAKPVVVENHVETHAIDQRYIDAINGIIRLSTAALSMKNHPTFNIYHGPSIGFSSACSSPRSPEICNTDGNTYEAMLQNSYHCSRTHMQRVQSSPSVCNLTGLQQSSPCVPPQMYPQNYYQQTIRYPPHQGYYSSRPPIDHHKCCGPERLISVRSVGRTEGVRYQADYGPSQYQPAPSRHSRGNNGCCMHLDDYGPGYDRRADRGNSRSSSPIPLSPRYGPMFVKPLDNGPGYDRRADRGNSRSSSPIPLSPRYGPMFVKPLDNGPGYDRRTDRGNSRSSSPIPLSPRYGPTFVKPSDNGPGYDRRTDRGNSRSSSPIPLSPRYGPMFVKPLDNAFAGES